MGTAEAYLKVHSLLELLCPLSPHVCQLGLVLLEGFLCQRNLYLLYPRTHVQADSISAVTCNAFAQALPLMLEKQAGVFVAKQLQHFCKQFASCSRDL